MSNNIKELEELLKTIEKKTGKTREQLAIEMKYNKGAFSQAKSRGKVSDKMIDAVKLHFAPILNQEGVFYNRDQMVKDILQHEAILKELINQTAKMMSKVSGRPLDDCLEEIEQNIALNLREKTKERMR